MHKLIILLLLVMSQVFGNIWLSRGMRQIGEINSLDPFVLFKIGLQILSNPWVWLGVTFLIISLLLYLTALSQLELSYVLPVTAASYVFNAVFASLILNEKISATRWIGTLIIAIGVLLVAISDALRNPRFRSPKATQAIKHKR